MTKRSDLTETFEIPHYFIDGLTEYERRGDGVVHTVAYRISGKQMVPVCEITMTEVAAKLANARRAGEMPEVAELILLHARAHGNA